MNYKHKRTTKTVWIGSALLVLAALYALLALPLISAAEESARAEASVRTVINGEEVTDIHKVDRSSDGSSATVRIKNEHSSSGEANVSTDISVSAGGTADVQPEAGNDSVVLNGESVSPQHLEELLERIRLLLIRLTTET